jgi:hypothetical protein
MRRLQAGLCCVLAMRQRVGGRCQGRSSCHRGQGMKRRRATHIWCSRNEGRGSGVNACHMRWGHPRRRRLPAHGRVGEGVWRRWRHKAMRWRRALRELRRRGRHHRWGPGARRQRRPWPDVGRRHGRVRVRVGVGVRWGHHQRPRPGTVRNGAWRACTARAAAPPQRLSARGTRFKRQSNPEGNF